MRTHRGPPPADRRPRRVLPIHSRCRSV